MLAFLFLCKNSSVFAGENPRILFMAKRQKTQEAVRIQFLLCPSDFIINIVYLIYHNFSASLKQISAVLKSPKRLYSSLILRKKKASFLVPRFRSRARS